MNNNDTMYISGILDILIYRLQVEKMYSLTQDDIYKHFEMHNIKTERLREKFNLAIAQLVSSNMIEINPNGIVLLTEEGLRAFNNQLFHSIAANLYSAERSNHLAKVAIIAASLLSVISILCTIIIAICSN